MSNHISEIGKDFTASLNDEVVHDPAWVILETTEPPTSIPKVYGVEKGAQLRVEVHTYGDGERIVSMECLCGACFEANEGGIEQSGEELPDGIHFFEAWHEAIRYPEGTEYDGGLRHTEEPEEIRSIEDVAMEGT